MWLYLIFLLALCSSSHQDEHYNDDVYTEKFEFGQNGIGEEVFCAKGEIGHLAEDHLTQIPIQTTNCYKLTYVSVTVRNRDSPPLVHVNFDTRAVTIRYRHSQYSASTFDIQAYGISDPTYCV